MVEEKLPTPEQLHERAQEIYERKATPERGPERELREGEKEVRKEIVEVQKEAPSPLEGEELSQTVTELLSLDDRSQLSELIKLAFTKDARYAVRVAQRLPNELVVDTFHDLLASDQLYYKLLKEKKL